MCRCGCRGWCSLRPIFSFLHWSFSCLASGRHAEHGHTRQAFLPSEETLRLRAGQPCPRAAVLYVKADLGEFGTSFAFPSTSHATEPCFICHCNRAELIKFDSWDVVAPPFAPKTFAEYISSCRACEQWRTIVSRDQHLAIRAILEYKRKVRARPVQTRVGQGLVLTKDFPRARPTQGRPSRNA